MTLTKPVREHAGVETTQLESSTPAAATAAGVARFGFWAAVSTGALTVVTFGLALTALPNKVPYPFTSEVIAAQWPGDYLWMYTAILLMLSFTALVAAVHQNAGPEQRIYSVLALCAGVASSTVLLIDYFIQVTVMQPSLEKDQVDGWAMLTQYNPNGVFIALEELGYLLMSLTLLCLAPVFTKRTRTERSLRRLFVATFAGTVTALAIVSALRGIDRGDVFEIMAICIVWLSLIIGTPLLATVFRRAADGSPVHSGSEVGR